VTSADVSLRWLLDDIYTDFGEDEPGSRLIGECVEIDGLFVDIPEPGPERLVLVDCVPEGRLLEAIAGIGTERAFLDQVSFESPGPGAGMHEADFHGVRVTGADGGRIELTGLVFPQRAYQPADELPEVDRWRVMLPDDDTTLGWCRTLEGVFRERPEFWPPAATLIGLRPRPWWREQVDRWLRGEQATVEVTASVSARGYDGREVGAYTDSLSGEVVAVRRSALGADLLDVELDGGAYDPIPAGARALWDSWLEKPPSEPGTWASLDTGMRHEWLRLALGHHRYGAAPDRPAGTVHRLDGRHVTDLNGFFCALGEAVNGPGGYFGWNWYAVEDCLRGAWGAAAPVRLVWGDAGIAREHWGSETLDGVVALLTAGRAEVVLD
jgi:hypothetical protein